MPVKELYGKFIKLIFRRAVKNPIFEALEIHTNETSGTIVISNTMRRSKIALMIGIGAMLISSCLRTEEYPPEPIITFDGYQLVDSVDQLGNENTFCIVTIAFTDGDGNVGLRPGDTTGRFHPDSLFYHNLLVDYYEWNDSINDFELIDDLDPSFSARIPYLTPTGKNKTLKGDIIYDLNVSFTNSDTVQFGFRLVDRDFNVSNTELSPVVIIN